jgi:hypothetical protein
MAQLSALEIQNWMALYAAASLCCAFAVVLSVGAVAIDLFREQAWTNMKTVKGAVLFMPKAWCRWQKLYLLSTPVTLAIVVSFAATLSWS